MLRDQRSGPGRRGFLERTLQGFLETIEHIDRADRSAQRMGLLQTLDPRVKLTGFLLLIVAVASARNLTCILIVFGGAMIAAIVSGIPLRHAAGVWTGALTLTLFLALPALFLTPGTPLAHVPGTGWAISSQGLTSACYLLSRVAATATLSMILVLSTSWNHLLKAMRALRVPLVLVVVAGMTYRYIHLLLQIARDMFEARRSRMVGPLPVGDTRQIVVDGAGVLLGKTMQLSGDVYLAMQARGYRGEVYLLDEFVMRPKDWTGLVLFAVLGAAALVYGR